MGCLERPSSGGSTGLDLSNGSLLGQSMDVPNGSCQREEKSKRKHDAVFSQHPQSVKANKLVSTDGGTQLMEIDSERISPSKEGIPSVLKGSLQKHICFLCAAKVRSIPVTVTKRKKMGRWGGLW